MNHNISAEITYSFKLQTYPSNNLEIKAILNEYQKVSHSDSDSVFVKI